LILPEDYFHSRNIGGGKDILKRRKNGKDIRIIKKIME
jgi:hypothetical protein